MNNVELNLSLPCEGQYDAIVIGGGSAGLGCGYFAKS